MDTFNKSKYLTLVSTNESKEKIWKYEELWDKIRDLISSITKNSDDFDKKYMKIKLNSCDELCLIKKLGIPSKIDLFFSMTDLLLDLFFLKKANIIQRFC